MPLQESIAKMARHNRFFIIQNLCGGKGTVFF